MGKSPQKKQTKQNKQQLPIRRLEEDMPKKQAAKPQAKQQTKTQTKTQTKQPTKQQTKQQTKQATRQQLPIRRLEEDMPKKQVKQQNKQQTNKQQAKPTSQQAKTPLKQPAKQQNKQKLTIRGIEDNMPEKLSTTRRQKDVSTGAAQKLAEKYKEAAPVNAMRQTGAAMGDFKLSQSSNDNKLSAMTQLRSAWHDTSNTAQAKSESGALHQINTKLMDDINKSIRNSMRQQYGDQYNWDTYNPVEYNPHTGEYTLNYTGGATQNPDGTWTYSGGKTLTQMEQETSRVNGDTSPRLHPAKNLGLSTGASMKAGAISDRGSQDQWLSRQSDATIHDALEERNTAARTEQLKQGYEESTGKKWEDKSWLGKKLFGAKAAVDSGLYGANQMLAKTVDFLLPTEVVFGKDNAFDKWLDDWYGNDSKYAKAFQNQYELAYNTSGSAGRLGMWTTRLVVENIPQSIVAIATAGASTVPELAADSGYSLLNTLQSAFKNPSFWTSFAQIAGTSYEDAKNNGADEATAIAHAYSTSILQSLIEIGGGLEKMNTQAAAQSLEELFRRTVNVAVEEGGEEVWQDITDNLLQMALYEPDKTIFSTTDQRALINPGRLAENFAGGAVVGGIMGGGQQGLSYAVNRAYQSANAQANVDTQQDASAEEADTAPTAQQSVSEQEIVPPETAQEQAQPEQKQTEPEHKQTENDKTVEEAKKTVSDAAESTVKTKGEQVVRAASETLHGDEEAVLRTLDSAGTETYINADMDTADASEKAAFAAAYASGLQVADGSAKAVNIENASEIIGETLASQAYDAGVQDRTEVHASTYADPEIMAQTFDAEGRSSFEQYRQTESAQGDPETYFEAFTRYYNAGLTDNLAEVDSSTWAKHISQSAAAAAFEAGTKDAAQRVEIRHEIQLSTNSGLAEDYAELDADTKETLDYLGKSLGVRIELTDTIKNGSKNASLEGDVIRVARDAEGKTINYIARAYTAHEISHRMQEFSPKQWKSFRDYALKQLSGHNADKAEQLISEKMDQYARDGEETSRQKALDEIAAEYAQDLLVDKQMIQKFIQSRPKAANNFFQKLKNAIRTVAKKVTGKTAAEKKFLRELTTAQRLWMECFTDAANKANGRVQDSGKQTKTRAAKPETTESLNKKSRKHTRYAAKKKAATGRLITQAEITKQFQADVHSILSGTYKGKGALLLGYTPEIMEKLGIPSLPVVIGEGHVYSIAKTKTQAYKEKTRYRMANYHGLGEAVVKNLYQYLNDPVMVIASKDVGNQFPVRSMHSVVAIIDIGQNNKNMLMPVEITVERNVNGKRIDVNVLSSTYLRNTDSLIENALAEENAGQIGIFYLDTKNEAASKVAERVRFPNQPTKDVASEIILHQVPEKVNLRVENQTQTKQFMRWFGDWQNSPSDASRIVNSDGTPKIVYYKSEDAQNGVHYLADTDNGGEKVYLNMRRPYRVKQQPNAQAEAQMIQYAQKKKYDGIIIQNGSSERYITFNSANIKSATDNIGTFDRTNQDKYYSVKKRSAQSYESEIERLKKQRDEAKRQIKLSRYQKVTPAGIERMARNLLSEYNSTADVNEVADTLQSLYKTLHSRPELIDTERAYNFAEIIAEQIIDNAVIMDTEMSETYADLLSDLKHHAISVPAENRNDLSDTWSNFKKQNRRYVQVTNSGTPVDVRYTELSEQYPELFPAEIINPAEQIELIAETARTLAPVERSLSEGEYSYAVDEMAQGIINQFKETATLSPTYADRQKIRFDTLKESTRKQIAELKQQQKKALDDLRTEMIRSGENYRQDSLQHQREAYEAKIAEIQQKIADLSQEKQDQRLADDMYFGRKAAEQKRIADEKLAAEKQRSREKVRTAVAQSDARRAAAEEIRQARRMNIPENVTQEHEHLPETTKLVGEYGAIEPGESPIRAVTLPKQTDASSRVRRFYRTTAESGQTSDRMVTELEHEVLNNAAASYIVQSNSTSLAKARQRINAGNEMAQWEAVVNGNHMPSAADVAMGELLLDRALRQNDTETALKLTEQLAYIGTKAGQVVQAMRMLKKLSGVSQIHYVNRSVQDMQRRLNARFGERAPKLTIPADLQAELMRAQTEEQKAEAQVAIFQAVAEQIPTTLSDKWHAWRYFAMLANLRTHIRNIVGNAVFMPAIIVKNTQSAIIEAIASRTVAKGMERTKTLRTLNMNNRTVGRTLAKQTFSGVKAEIANGGKYNGTDQIRDMQHTFDSKLGRVLEKAMDMNTEALDQEDVFFQKIQYRNALTSYILANGYTETDLLTEEGEPTAAMNKAMAYAVKEAQKATYHDASALANSLQQFSRSGRIQHLITEGLMPFKKTPINILKRAVEYSPAGLLHTLTVKSKALANGDITPAEYIDSLSQGLTGTEVLAMGVFMAAHGLLRASGGDDKDKNMYEEYGLGKQSYSIQWGDNSYTIDFAAPMVMPLMVGAELHSSFGKDLTAADVLNALTLIGEPFISLSMMDGIESTFSSIADSEHKLTDAAVSVAGSYVSQAVPTLFGQFARIGQENAKTTYTDPDSWIPIYAQKILYKSRNKIPAIPIPKALQGTAIGEKLQWYNEHCTIAAGANLVDDWGRLQSNGNIFFRMFSNFVSPGYYSRIQTSATDKELLRLYDKFGADANILPEYMSKTMSVDKDGQQERVSLTRDEWTNYKIEYGTRAYKLLTKMIASDIYTSATDDEKVELLQDVYKYAKGTAAMAVRSDAHVSDSVRELADSGVNPVLGITTNAALKKLTDSFGDDATNKEKQAAKFDYINALDINSVQKGLLSKMYASAKQSPDYANTETFTITQMSDSAQEKWQKAKADGWSDAEKYRDLYTIVSGKGKKDEKQAAAAAAGFSNSDFNYIWKLYHTRKE